MELGWDLAQSRRPDTTTAGSSIYSIPIGREHGPAHRGRTRRRMGGARGAERARRGNAGVKAVLPAGWSRSVLKTARAPKGDNKRKAI